MLRFYTLIVFGAAMIVGLILFTAPVQAAGQCYCYTELSIPGNLTAKDVADPVRFNAVCIDVPQADCKIGTPQTGAPFTNCSFASSTQACLDQVSDWRVLRDNIVSQLEKQSKENVVTQQRRGLIGAILPKCVFETSVQDECKDVSVFIQLAINIVSVVLTIIGSIALGVFIYGGFILILSEGSPDRVKKGTGAMMAAIIGLAVVFGAYLLVKVLGDAIGIEDKFNLF